MTEIIKGQNKFYVGEDPQNILAEITFVPMGDNEILIDHTFVSPDLRGQGIALELVKKVAEYARKENKKVIPRCSYARKAMHEDLECDDILKDEDILKYEW